MNLLIFYLGLALEVAYCLYCIIRCEKEKKREKEERLQNELRWEYKIAVENGETNLTFEFWCMERGTKAIAKIMHDMMYLNDGEG